MSSSRSRTTTPTSMAFDSASKSCSSKVLQTDLRIGEDQSFLLHVVQMLELFRRNRACRRNLQHWQVFLFSQLSQSPMLFSGTRRRYAPQYRQNDSTSESNKKND